MSFILDNSIAVNWLLNNGSKKDNHYAISILSSMKSNGAHAPNIWPLEAANVIAKAEKQNLIQKNETLEFLETLMALKIIIDETTTQRAFQDILVIARQYNLSSYDAAYLELAMRKNLPLATLDVALEKAAKKAGVKRFEPNQ